MGQAQCFARSMLNGGLVWIPLPETSLQEYKDAALLRRAELVEAYALEPNMSSIPEAYRMGCPPSTLAWARSQGAARQTPIPGQTLMLSTFSRKRLQGRGTQFGALQVMATKHLARVRSSIHEGQLLALSLDIVHLRLFHYSESVQLI